MRINELVSIGIYIIVIGTICWLMWWLVNYLGVPEPFAKVLRGIIAVVAVLFLIGALLSLLGQPLNIAPLRLR